MKMNEDFLKSMTDAFELLRTKGPQEATAAVQRALAGGKANEARADYVPASNTPSNAGEWAQAWTQMRTQTQAQARPAPHAPGAPAFDADSPGAFSTHTFSNSAGQRQYKLYVPAVYNSEPLPLIVMLHGCTQNADDFAAGTRMNEMAERHGFIVVYPNQAQAANHSKCWNWFKPADQLRDEGEPSLIAGITREVMGRYR
ncbi:alpha/beta hydrolase family esterase, partial [Paraburkholderia dipogonis]